MKLSTSCRVQLRMEKEHDLNKVVRPGFVL
jgi:hypothetical protein